MRKCGRWWQVDVDIAGPHLSLAVRGRSSLLHLTFWFILPLFASLYCSTNRSSCFKVIASLAVCPFCSAWQIKRGYFLTCVCTHDVKGWVTPPALQWSGLLCSWRPHGKDGDALLDLKIQTVAADKHFPRLWLWASLIHYNCRCIIRCCFFFFFITTDDLLVI